mgnify:CR=1 FL=1
MYKPIFLSLAMAAASLPAIADKPLPYLDDTLPIEQRVEDALSRMTTAEKVAFIHAQSKFSSPGVRRLGIPENWMTDGPHGIRAEVLWDEWNWANWTNDSCTAYPALTALAATWNPDMADLYGRSIGAEARYRNKNVLLGPGVNIYRSPLNGRNFEYMGEDPYLASRMVVPYIKGVQSNGVAACIKHYALNNQEVDRDHVDVRVDDRTLHEIYLPAFKAAVTEADAWSIMPGYNKYDGDHACENRRLLLDILKGDWGFDGVAISDWGAVHNTDKVVANGLDMEFGSWTNGLDWGESNAYNNYYMAAPYLKGLEDGTYSIADLDDKVRRVLRLSMRTTMDRNRPFGSFATEEHALAARTIAEEAIVLLKNAPVKGHGKTPALPLDAKKLRKILVVGENAVHCMTLGGGSSQLKTFREISPLEGIRNVAGKDCDIEFLTGYESPAEAPQDRPDAKVEEQHPIDYAALRAQAVAAAREADAVIFIGGLNKNRFQDCEGVDRTEYALPYEQNELIDALAKANPYTVVVILSGNAVATPWRSKVPAIVEGWYSGSEGGNALARVLFGEVNPSGKLPFTFADKLTDYPAHATGDAHLYPGVDGIVTYSEGLNVGYRSPSLNSVFPFGHGLSYTTFSLGKPSVDKTTFAPGESVTVTVPVTNTGKRAGAEVVQVYVSDPQSALPRPEKELKGFDKVFVEPGETVNATVTLTPDAFKYYDPSKASADNRETGWVEEPGTFNLLIGTSSTDLPRKVSVKLN